MQRPNLHPVDRPVLSPLMLLFLLAGTGLLLVGNEDPGHYLLRALAVLSYTCFVVLFALYWLGWLLREHELWREKRRGREE